MSIRALHSFLVHPSKNVDTQPKIRGAKLDHSGKLFTMLKEIYDKADTECDIDISFVPSNGKQQNDCRDLVLKYISSSRITTGRMLAQMLQNVTTKRSDLGLLFLIAGQESPLNKFVIARFPAESGILADETRSTLTVEFIERVFMKNARAYKAAVFKGSSLTSDFWDGRAVDKQLEEQSASYWIKGFLMADYKATAAAATKRLALALRHATRRATDINIKQELTAAARLATNLDGRPTSGERFTTKFHLSSSAASLLKAEMKTDRVFHEVFTFSKSEFITHVTFQSIELNNGGVLTADAAQFDQVFVQEPIGDGSGDTKYTTIGKEVAV